MKLSPLLAAAVVSAAPFFAVSEVSQKPVSLEDCVQLALQHNFDIKLQRFGPRLTDLDLSTAYAPYDPTFFTSAGQRYGRSESLAVPSATFNPPSNENWGDTYSTGLGGYLPTGLRYDFYGDVRRNQTTILPSGQTGSFDYSPDAGISLTQPLLKNAWIDSTRWTIALNRLTLKSNYESVRGQVIDTLRDVEVAYYNLISAAENVQVQVKAVEVAERFLFETRKRVEVGAMAPLEAKSAEAEVARRQSDLVTGRQNLADNERALKRLLDEDFSNSADTMLTPSAKLGIPKVLVNRKDSWGRAFERRPDYRQQKITLEQQKVTLRYNRNQLFPQLDLSGSYGVTGRSTEVGPAINELGNRSNPNYAWGIKLTIPLDNLAARNGYKKAKLQQEQLLLKFKQTEQSIMIQIDVDVRAVESAAEKIKATRQAREYAEAALDAEQKKLESGKSTNYQVLQFQRDLTTAQTSEISALADYNRALAQLSHDEGSSLERHSIKVDLR